jgi:phosphoserine aminotransferase
MKKYNFNAGPSALPNDVFKYSSKAIEELDNTGLSILEISHRSDKFLEIINKAKDLALEISNLDSNDYEVLFLQGGASHQYLMVASNFLNNVAGYVNTGTWSEKAISEAKYYGEVIEVASSKNKNHTYIPNNIEVLDDLDYLHVTSNNTIFGTQFHKFPVTKSPLIADMSSDIFSRKINFSSFDLIYAGAQKNIGAAGVTMVIIKKELLNQHKRKIPSILSYQNHVNKQSLYNTPPVFSIYTCMLNMEWILKSGGIEEIEKKNIEKAKLIYDEIDNNDAFYGFVERPDRSVMNATFGINDNYDSEKFNKMCSNNNIHGIKGHRSVGGYRVSLYNAISINSVKILVEIMKKFNKEG